MAKRTPQLNKLIRSLFKDRRAKAANIKIDFQNVDAGYTIARVGEPLLKTVIDEAGAGQIMLLHVYADGGFGRRLGQISLVSLKKGQWTVSVKESVRSTLLDKLVGISGIRD